MEAKDNITIWRYSSQPIPDSKQFVQSSRIFYVFPQDANS